MEDDIEFFVTGEVGDLRNTWTVLREAMRRQPLSTPRDDIPTDAAIAFANGQNGAVIAAFNQDRVLVGWLQLATTRYLFTRHVSVSVVQYWGDDTYLASSMFEALLGDACDFTLNAWGSQLLNIVIYQESLLPCLQRYGAQIARVDFNPVRWFCSMHTAQEAAVEAQRLQRNHTHAPRYLQMERA